MEDEKIVSKIFHREEEGLQALIDKYETYCFTIAQRITQNTEDAMECVNDTWLKTWDTIPPCKPEYLQGYVAKITRNLAINKRKLGMTKKRGGDLVQVALEELDECIPGDSNVENKILEKHLESTIYHFLKKQSVEKRVCFIKRYFYFEEIKQIAEEMDMKDGSVKSNLHRVRKQLRVYLRQEGIDYE